jgi:hypothetical protein
MSTKVGILPQVLIPLAPANDHGLLDPNIKLILIQVLFGVIQAG